MDNWVKNLSALSNAKVPKGWRPELPVHALPKKLRREMCFTESTEHLKEKKKKRPKSAVPRPTQKQNQPPAITAKKRPMSASANLQRRHRPSSTSNSSKTTTRRTPRKTADTSTIQPETTYPSPETTLSTALTSFFSSLTSFDSKMHRTQATQRLLMSRLEASIIDLNRVNPCTEIHEERERERRREGIKGGGEGDLINLPSSQWREPWHFGKPNAYVSPVLQHKMEKQDKKFKFKANHRRPGSAKNPSKKLKEYRNTTRERGVKTERPWSAPTTRKPSSQKKMKVKRFYVNLENVSVGPESTLELLVKLATALKPSGSSTVLPFVLNLNLKRNQLDATILKFWSKGASEFLRQVLIHPGVEGVDMQYNGAPLSSTTMNTCTDQTVDKTVDYTADFEDDEDEQEDDEVAAFTSLSLENVDDIPGTLSRPSSSSREVVNLALEQRNLLHRASGSPPLVDLFLSEQDDQTRQRTVNLASPAPPTEHEIRTARTRRMTFSQSGYLTEPPRTTIVPSAGLNPTEDTLLPSFNKLMDTIDNAVDFTDLNELSSELIDGGLLFTTESMELAKERNKGIMHKSNFRMKGLKAQG
ncbi:hypothetical protein TrLO_g6999 [Triparma laevis f. longispina]|nr:hypothetical protein TrLO_g6999 [Triparma laevis f. longispina]